MLDDIIVEYKSHLHDLSFSMCCLSHWIPQLTERLLVVRDHKKFVAVGFCLGGKTFGLRSFTR